MTSDLVVDLCAGPGGWDEGARVAGYSGGLIGLDSDPNACRTAVAAGHQRICVDVTRYPLAPFVGRVSGVIASPPCPDWSIAGSRRGYAGASGQLLHEPLRWVLGLRPEWTAWECTPGREVAARFAADADVLRRAGYHAWSGVMNACDYGVASTRRRQILMASRSLFALPIVESRRSMAEVLGWDGAVLVSNYGTSGNARNRGRRVMSGAAFTMTGKCCRNRWEWPDRSTRNLTIAEAAQLQGFRFDYPWFGGRIAQQQQIGDAVPPPLAKAIIGALLPRGGSQLTHRVDSAKVGTWLG